MVNVQQAVRTYFDMGLDPIPLRPLSKNPLRGEWSSFDPLIQWRNAPTQSNIGLRCGGVEALCVIDSDDKVRPTWNNIVDFLWGLGLEPNSYPVISTPHQGRHIYLSLDGELPGDYRKLRSDLGSGELRYGKGSYVAAPPSFLPDGGYSIENGDVSRRPLVKAKDILAILGKDTQPADNKTSIRRKPSKQTFALLRGENIGRYQSRSEAEQAILTNLAGCGYSFQDVLTLFCYNPAAGKFREIWEHNPLTAEKWLERSYMKALAYISSYDSPLMNQLLCQLAWASNRAWPGITGSSDRATYLAHLSIALNAYKAIYAASTRDLAERSGLYRTTVERANKRLIFQGLIHVDRNNEGQNATEYKILLQDASTLSQVVDERVDASCNITAHDAFRFRGLGKSAGEVYSALRRQPSTKKELVEKTGKCNTTVDRALKRMAKLADPDTGEIYPMVFLEGKVWYALDIELDRVADYVGTAGALRRQKKKHRDERASFRRHCGLPMESGTSN